MRTYTFNECKDQARDVASLSSRLEKESENVWLKFTDLVTSTERGKRTIAEIQERANAQEHRVTDLLNLIQEETASRQALTNKVVRKKSKALPKKAQDIPEAE